MKKNIWPIRGRHIVAAERLNNADANAAEQRAFDAAHAAEDHDDERDQNEIESDGRKHGKQRHHDASRQADQRGATRKCDEEYSRNRNAHQHRGLAVLDRRADGLAEIGGADQPLQEQGAERS